MPDTSTTCTICHSPGPTGTYACVACVRRLRAALTELRHQMPLLRASLHPGASPRTGTTTAGRAHAPLPVRGDVLSLIGPAAAGTVRGHAEDQTGPAPILSVLRAWTELAAAELGHRPPPRQTVDQCAVYLADHLPWARTRPWVPDLNTELHDLLHRVRAITRTEPRTRPLPAPCTCGAFGLTRKDWAEYIECTVCERLLTEAEYDQHAAQVLPPLYRLSILIAAAGSAGTVTA